MTKIEKDILRYLELVERRVYIIEHSGIDWLPEYQGEMVQIDKEIAQLRDVLGMEKSPGSGHLPGDDN